MARLTAFTRNGNATAKYGIVAAFGLMHIAAYAQSAAAWPARAPPASSAASAGAHRCAVFGGTAGAACDNYPEWTAGAWTPPAQARVLHVLIVGGGGGGGGSIERGIGGAGGASGQVINGTVEAPANGKPIRVVVGWAGRGGSQYRVGGGHGRASVIGTLVALGGTGGMATSGGGARPVAIAAPGTAASPDLPGGSGGGGAGGGTYQHAGSGGDGGAGGTAGGRGLDGQPGTDLPVPVPGTLGGSGSRFPGMGFSLVEITAGKGGQAGAHGSFRVGYGGGGGGGGGGIVVAGMAPNAAAGDSGLNPHDALGGGGGRGFGAGGGGGGNFQIGAHGGGGTRGLVYVEWVQVIS